MSTNNQPAAIGPASSELMTKVMLRAKETIQGVFLDSLSDEQYQAMVREAIDEFLHGPVAKRYKWVNQANEMRLDSLEELSDDYRLATYSRHWSGPGMYSVQKRVQNDDYDPRTDPTTLPGMIAKMIKDEVKENFIKEIMAAPEIQQEFISNPDGNSYHVFRKFAEKFLLDNWVAIRNREMEVTISGMMYRILSDMRR